ncbi:MAG: methylmalonyl-CoA epimerase [Anaerolineales bacterium]|jgi:methylmalonyl-CoA/ethylmalonyl-CoA epimerase
MTHILGIKHVAVVVEDIQESLRFWQDILGLQVSAIEEVPDQDSVVAFLDTGAIQVELVEPTKDDSGLARFLRKRGPGLHHVCFEVGDLEQSLEHLRSHGVRLIEDASPHGVGGKRVAFIHPESTEGVLVELYEMAS